MTVIKKNLNRKNDASLKTLKVAMNLIFDRVFLANFTWTGKSKPGSQKIALRKHERLVELLFVIVSDLHTKYDKNTFQDQLINSVLKYSYE